MDLRKRKGIKLHIKQIQFMVRKLFEFPVLLILLGEYVYDAFLTDF